MMLRQHDRGIAEAEKAVALNPNGALEQAYLSSILRYSGRCEEAVQMRERAMRLNPFPHGSHYRGLAAVYMCVGRYEEAIAACTKALNLNPNDLLTHITLAAAYSRSGREEEARAQAEEVLKINPKFSLEKLAKRLPYKNPADRERAVEALRKAGLK
jgi:adenylate cyclase